MFGRSKETSKNFDKTPKYVYLPSLMLNKVGDKKNVTLQLDI